MADFQIAFKITLGNEGDYQCMKEDSGNYVDGKLIGTKYGITAQDLKDYLGTIPTPDEMKNLSLDVAQAIYHKNYWQAIRGDEIKDNQVASELYDSAVNMGVGTAIILAQRSLGLPETGKMDNNTLNKLNA